MPELPEVETVVRELRSTVLKRRIVAARLLKPDILKKCDSKSHEFANFFCGGLFETVERRGKYIIFSLNNGDRLLAHLGMSGKFVLSDADQPEPAHLCSQYCFEDGSRLDHVDVRRLGRLELYSAGAAIPILEKLGIDPLSPDFHPNCLENLVYTKKNRTPRTRAIHTLLLDQSLISGVGNIYASEALFRAGVRPDKAAGQLKPRHRQRLAEALRSVMKEALKLGGTTINDYRRVDDKPGDFLSLLQVYDHAGQPCRLCGTDIQRVRLNGRSAFFCPKCQR